MLQLCLERILPPQERVKLQAKQLVSIIVVLQKESARKCTFRHVGVLLLLYTSDEKKSLHSDWTNSSGFEGYLIRIMHPTTTYLLGALSKRDVKKSIYSTLLDFMQESDDLAH